MVLKYFIALENHSLLYCTGLFALGIMAQSAELSTELQLLCAIGALLFLWILNKPKITFALFLIASYIGGALSYRHQLSRYTFKELSQQEGRAQQNQGTLNGVEFEIIGTVVQIATLNNKRSAQSIIVSSNLLIVSEDNGAVQARKTMQFYVAQKTNLAVGDSVRIKNLILKPHKNHLYSFYLMKENIDASFFIQKDQCQLLERPKYSLSRFIAGVRSRLISHAKNNLNPQAFALFASIFLGNKTDSKEDLLESKESYKVWGISHYLARSGLHLVIVIFVWNFLLNLMPISFLLKQCAMLMCAIIYCCCSWSSVSFLRAFAVFILYKTCLIIKVPIRVLHLLSIVTLGVLIFNPAQLFFLDFQLSFGLTYALAWFNHVYKLKHG